MKDEVARVARVYLEPLTPLHIGAGKGGGKPLVDKCIGTGFRLEPEEWPAGQVVSIKVVDGTNQPYIPGSTIKGMLRAMYEFAAGEGPAEKLLGSQERASKILFNDLMPSKNSVKEELIQTYTLECFCPYKARIGECIGRLKRPFSHQFIIASSEDAPVIFQGTVLFFEDSLLLILQTIFDRSKDLGNLLTVGGNNPEKALATKYNFKSYINNETFFESEEKKYVITWKLGKFAKAYSKALDRERRLRSGRNRKKLPYAFLTIVDGEEKILPGWVKLTIDLTEAKEFELNLMGG